MRKFLLLLNGNLGLRVLRYLSAQSEVEIIGVVMNSSEKRTPSYYSELVQLTSNYTIFEYSETLWHHSEFTQVMAQSNVAVSSLFGHVIPSSVVEHFGSSIINLHPSLLPIGRGSDPIAWGVIHNKPQGVSIHELVNGLDSGPIISQSKLDVNFGMTAGEIYELAMDKLFSLFQEYIEAWPNQINSTPQEGESTFHKSSDLQDLRKELLQGIPEMERYLRIIQGLTFADGRTPLLRLSNGELWNISLSISRIVE